MMAMVHFKTDRLISAGRWGGGGGGRAVYKLTRGIARQLKRVKL